MTETESPPPPIVDDQSLEEIAPGVCVIPDHRVPLVPNVGIVVGEHSALVVDTGMGPRNGLRVLDRARSVTDRPLVLTLTHFHPEHGFGAQAFEGAARLVYNRAQAEELDEKGTAYVDMFRTFGDSVAAQLEGVELVHADDLYDGETTIDLGGLTAELREVGPAHTRGDQVVVVREHGVLFAGDLLETRFFPIFPPGDADVSGSRWIEVLELLASLAPRTIVPGHGDVTGPELIWEVRTYLEDVRDRVREASAGDATVEEVKAKLEPAIRGAYPSWDAPEWIGFAIESFHAELDG
jgi:glyoxylase-like metal-dependent hydrolase (beta-lactamase superfamily II)